MIGDSFHLRFKSHTRAYFSALFFVVLFILSLLSNVIANDKPLFIYYNNQIYTPWLSSLTEQDFGSDLPIKVDYQLPSFRAMIKQKGGWIIDAPIPYTYDTIDFYTKEAFPAPPSKDHWLGTDASGHDVLAILLYGLRISILFGLILSAASTVIGVFIGGICGYFGGVVDLIGQRFLELWSSLPTLYILIILSSLISPSFWTLLLIMTLVSWMGVVGVVRAEFFRIRTMDYVTCAKIMGASHAYIARRHILPNALTATLTLLPFLISGAIVGLSALDFLGFGLPVEYPSLGKLMLVAKQNLQAPWISFSAFGTLTLILTLLVFTGEGLRDALDPRQKQST